MCEVCRPTGRQFGVSVEGGTHGRFADYKSACRHDGDRIAVIAVGKQGRLGKDGPRPCSLEYELLAARLESNEMHLAFQNMMHCPNDVTLAEEVLSDRECA